MPHFPIGPDGKYVLPRLTAPYLRALYQREPSPIVRELLWEVHRLRLLVLRANQLQQEMTGAYPPATQLMLEILRREYAGEPCIEERQEWADGFFGHVPNRAAMRESARSRSSLLLAGGLLRFAVFQLPMSCSCSAAGQLVLLGKLLNLHR